MRVFVVPAFARCLVAVSALVAGCALGAGCSNSAQADAPPDKGVAGQPSDDGTPESLQFELSDSELVRPLVARQQVTLRVQALPAKVYHLRFALPTSGGDPLDAVLDQAEVDTGADGIATVLLTAPSAPTTFDVRATAGGRTATLSVAVQDTGFATLQVQPLYAGFRTITTWVASAYPEKTCAELSGVPPEDGPLQTLPAAAVAAPILPRVPASTRLAVTLRSGHFVGGCASVEKVPPGPENKPQIVEVTVLDRPIDLGSSPLAVSFGAAVPETTWSGLLEASQTGMLQAMLGTSTDDVDAVLDAMREASGSALQSFETTRKAEGWDDLLRAHWGNNAATKLRDTTATWLLAGRQTFDASSRLFTGTLTPIPQPGDPLDQRSADFTLLSVAGLAGVNSGFVDRAKVSWSASSGDTLVIGTDLYFIQSRFAAALAEAAARGQVEAADPPSGPALLAEALDCAGLGAALVAAGTSSGVAYDDCDADCLTSLCQTGVAAIWTRAGEATGLAPARLSLTATGTARVGDAAEVVGVSGTWIGALTTAETDTATGGLLTGVAPAER